MIAKIKIASHMEQETLLQSSANRESDMDQIKESLQAECIMVLEVICDKADIVGKSDLGYFRSIPIIGGKVSGKINGEILPGGFDWNTCYGGETDQDSTTKNMEARYLIRTDDDVIIAIYNRVFEDLTKPRRHVVCTPYFTAPAGKYQWLNTGVKVGVMTSGPKDGKFVVRIQVYLMD